jgi:hypothetical protein
LQDCSTLKQKREPVSHNVSVRFREAEVKIVEELAFEDDMSMGAWIRRHILKIFPKRGKVVPTNGTVTEEKSEP